MIIKVKYFSTKRRHWAMGGGVWGAELANFVAVAKVVAKKSAPAADPANHGGGQYAPENAPTAHFWGGMTCRPKMPVPRILG